MPFSYKQGGFVNTSFLEIVRALSAPGLPLIEGSPLACFLISWYIIVHVYSANRFPLIGGGPQPDPSETRHGFPLMRGFSILFIQIHPLLI
jgi:hypothetical protein